MNQTLAKRVSEVFQTENPDADAPVAMNDDLLSLQLDHETINILPLLSRKQRHL